MESGTRDVKFLTTALPIDPKFLALKDLDPFSTVYKVQEDGKILRMGFDLSKWPHLLHKMGFDDSLTHTTVCML